MHRCSHGAPSGLWCCFLALCFFFNGFQEVSKVKGVAGVRRGILSIALVTEDIVIIVVALVVRQVRVLPGQAFLVIVFRRLGQVDNV
jgi:hypothetical protein